MKDKKHLKIMIPVVSAALALLIAAGVFFSLNFFNQKSTKNSEKDIDYVFPDAKMFGDEKDIKLSVWAPAEEVEITRELAEVFKNHYPDVKINSIEVEEHGENDAVIITSEPPGDVIYVRSSELGKMCDAQLFSPVSQDFVNDIQDSNYEQCIDAVTSDNTIYAYPYSCGYGCYLVYDKSVVSDSDAETLEGVLKACKNAGKKFVTENTNGYFACAYAFTGGVIPNGFEDDSVTQRFAEYNEETAVETLQAFAKLLKEYKGIILSDQPSGYIFENGTAAAGISGSRNANKEYEALKSNYGAAKLPTIRVGNEDKQMVSIQDFAGYGVNTHSDFPNASQMLAYFLSCEKCQIERAKATGLAPSRKKAQETMSEDPVIKAVTKQLPFTVSSKELSGSFWYNMGKLGTELSGDSFDPDDRETAKELLQKTVNNIIENKD